MRNDEAGAGNAGPDTASDAAEDTAQVVPGAPPSTDRMNVRVGGPVNRWTFSLAEVAYLLALAYQTGRVHGDADMAETQHCWTVHASPRRTYEQRVADRLAAMEERAAAIAVRRFETHGRVPWHYRGGPVDWQTSRPLSGGPS